MLPCIFCIDQGLIINFNSNKIKVRNPIAIKGLKLIKVIINKLQELKMSKSATAIESASNSQTYLEWAAKYPHSKTREKWDTMLAGLIQPDIGAAYSPKELRDIAKKLCH